MRDFRLSGAGMTPSYGTIARSICAVIPRSEAEGVNAQNGVAFRYKTPLQASEHPSVASTLLAAECVGTSALASVQLAHQLCTPPCE